MLDNLAYWTFVRDILQSNLEETRVNISVKWRQFTYTDDADEGRLNALANQIADLTLDAVQTRLELRHADARLAEIRNALGF